jgi:hydrogenase nickel incorporation protein HypA/HybF
MCHSCRIAATSSRGAPVHEFSITQSVVEICEKNAAGRRVSAVVLEIGALSGVMPDAVEFCFEACVQGTLLEGAILTIERIPGAGCCSHCGAEFQVRAYYDPCPACGGYGVAITAGEELRVRELEVD